MSDHVLTKRRGAIGLITLNRPEKLNALVGTMRQDLGAALTDLQRDPEIRVLVLTGAGRGFCAGGDIHYMVELKGCSPEEGLEGFTELVEMGTDVARTIHHSAKVHIAAVNGPAAGAGCNLALACDLRLAAESASFTESFVRLGLHPDWGGTYFLPRLVGTARAAEMMLTGRKVSAEDAFRMGIVNRVLPDDRLLDEAMALAEEIARHPADALRLIKKGVQAGETFPLEEMLDYETRAQKYLWKSEAVTHALRNFGTRKS